jgi:hypothetical protein
MTTLLLLANCSTAPLCKRIRAEDQEDGVSRHFSYQVIRGELKEMYDPYHVTFSLIPFPGKEGEQCIAGWKAEFDLINPHAPLPEKAKDAALGFLKLLILRSLQLVRPYV